MKIYTKTGDKGETGLYGGKRVPKDALRLHAYGTIDELNAIIGAARLLVNKDIDKILEVMQNHLFILGGHLATPEENLDVPRIQTAHVETLERYIDELSQGLPVLKNFIIPSGSSSSTSLHVARAVCRRAERWVVALSRHARVGDAVLAYVNRLSDLFFIIARCENVARGIAEQEWKGK